MTPILTSLRTTLSGYLRYKGREGHYSFLMHRLTGLGTLLFLIIHILDTATVYFFPSLYEHAIALYQSTPFMLGEIGLVFAVIYHGINGLRISIWDLRLPERWAIATQRGGVRMTFIVSVILWLPAAGVMMYNMLHHNFGMFGG